MRQTDKHYMTLALELAARGTGWTAPNPMVGAVIVKDGEIIGRGWHQKYGGLHAEREALADCSVSPAGATLYVTLEPCCHHGKQPPCTEAILAAGIRRVVVGAGDPNPLVAGKGIRILREHGVEVTEHVLEEECVRLNPVFFHYIQTRTPYVVLKYAMTMDGKIATRTGASQWITGETARQHVQLQRHKYRAIMAGIGTVLADDPLLTCRLPECRTPVRVICDSALRIPMESRIVHTAKEVPTLLAACRPDPERVAALTAAGCEVLTLPEEDSHVSLPALMAALADRSIDSVLLEGGGALNWSALRSGIVQRVQAYVAPKLFGGAAAKSPVGGKGVSLPEDAFRLTNSTVTRLGEDFLIESEVVPLVHGDH